MNQSTCVSAELFSIKSWNGLVDFFKSNISDKRIVASAPAASCATLLLQHLNESLMSLNLTGQRSALIGLLPAKEV